MVCLWKTMVLFCKYHGITMVFLAYHIPWYMKYLDIISVVFCKGGVTMFVCVCVYVCGYYTPMIVCLNTKMMGISWYLWSSLMKNKVLCYIFMLIQWFVLGKDKLSVKHGKPALICFEGRRRTLSCVSLEDLALIPSAKFHTIWTLVQLSGLIYRSTVCVCVYNEMSWCHSSAVGVTRARE